MRPLVFLVSVLLGVAGAGLVNWWVDPFADRYDGRAVGEALARPNPCFLSHTVVGERTWPEFKLDLFRRRRATTVVVGTSRVWKLRAGGSRERFANLSLPGMPVEDLRPLFERLHAIDARPLTVYLDTEELWFSGRRRGPLLFTPSRWRDLKELLSGETLRATVATLRRAPGAVRHPRALRPWQVVEVPDGCLVDRDASVERGASNAWGPDGSWWWRWELLGLPEERGQAFVAAQRRYLAGDRLEPQRVAALDRALAYAKEHGWRVVGVAPPFARDSFEELSTDADLSGLFRDFRRELPRVYAHHGYVLLDLSDVRSVPCPDSAFSFSDGAHPDAACSARIMARLERAARVAG